MLQLSYSSPTRVFARRFLCVPLAEKSQYYNNTHMHWIAMFFQPTRQASEGTTSRVGVHTGSRDLPQGIVGTGLFPTKLETNVAVHTSRVAQIRSRNRYLGARLSIYTVDKIQLPHHILLISLSLQQIITLTCSAKVAVRGVLSW